MKVNDLIEKLKELADDGFGETDVHFSYNYGDHWSTQVAPISKRVNLCNVKKSSYHRMPVITENENENETPVVVIQ
jgi:hypothetical protein